jgi:succinate-acetate transporter protein
MAMIFLPLYPMTIGEHIYSVSLSVYGDLAVHGVGIYWVLFAALIVIGLIEVGLAKWHKNKSPVAVTYISIGLSIITVLFLMISREVYATVLVFSLLIIKGILLLKSIKTLAQP